MIKTRKRKKIKKNDYSKEENNVILPEGEISLLFFSKVE